MIIPPRIREIINDLDMALACHICGHLLLTATLAPCGHVFCHTCLAPPQSSEQACRECGRPYRLEDLRPFHQLSAQVQAFSTLASAHEREYGSPLQSTVEMSGRTDAGISWMMGTSSPLGTNDAVIISPGMGEGSPHPIRSILLDACWRGTLTPDSSKLDELREMERQIMGKLEKFMQRKGGSSMVDIPEENSTTAGECDLSVLLEESHAKGTPVQYRFAHSGLSQSQIRTVQKAANQLSQIEGSTQTTTSSVHDEFSLETTHVIVTSTRASISAPRISKRTEKYLSGLATGCWIVDMAWIHASIKARHWISPEAYEIGGDTVNGPVDAPRRSRMAPKEKRLFSGLSFFVEKSACTLKDYNSYVGLIVRAGGRMVSKGEEVDIRIGPRSASNRPYTWIVDTISRWSLPLV